MKKSTKFIEKALALFLVVLMSINSFGAVVSDNDGAAFITKAEFDSLKNTFQAQLDEYNTSIDSKIDIAIASYLSGLTTSQQPALLMDNVNAVIGGVCWFKNNFPGTGLAANTTNLNWKLTRDYQYRYWGGVTWSGKIHYYRSGTTEAPKYNCIAGTQLCWSGDDVNNRIIFSETTYDITDNINMTSLDIGDTWTQWWGRSTGAYFEFPEITTIVSGSTPGTGSAWISELKPNGARILKEYCTSIFPRQTVNLHAKSWGQRGGTYNQDNFVAWYVTPGGLGYTTVMATLALPRLESWTVRMKDDAADTIGTETDTERNTLIGGNAYKQWYELRQDLSKQTDGKDYSIYMWGRNADSSLYWLDSKILPEVATATRTQNADASKSSFYALRFPPSGPVLSENPLSGQAFSYYPISISPKRNNANDFVNIYLSNYFNEDIYIDNGIPFLKTVQDNQKIRLKIKFKTSAGSGVVHFKISDDKFENNSFRSGSKIRIDRAVAAGSENTIDIDTGDKGYLWLTCYAETNNVDAAVDTVAATLVS